MPFGFGSSPTKPLSKAKAEAKRNTMMQNAQAILAHAIAAEAQGEHVIAEHQFEIALGMEREAMTI